MMQTPQPALLSIILIQILNSVSLTIDSVYVIIDPASTNSKPVIQLKDHYSYEQQRIGYMNEYVSALYIKGTGTESWCKMQDDQQKYILDSNLTLNKPMSLKLTFVEEQQTNYTWNSFLYNLEGTTIYRLYISATYSTSPTQITTNISTISTITPTQISMDETAVTYSTILTTKDSNEVEYLIPQQNSDHTLIFNQLFVSLVLVSAVSVVLLICCISICCCFCFYQRIHSINKTDYDVRGTDTEDASLRVYCSSNSVSKQHMLGKNSEGVRESVVRMDSDSPRFHNPRNGNVVYNDDEPKLALFKNTSNQKKDADSDDTMLSPGSKSRVSISLHSAQPGLGNISHTYSLSMDQLIQLQKGISVQTVDGISIKLDNQDQYNSADKDTNNRNRILSLIKTYETNGCSSHYKQYSHLPGVNDEDSSSNESLYNYQQKHDGMNTPTDTPNRNCAVYAIDVNKITLPEEGITSTTEAQSQ